MGYKYKNKESFLDGVKYCVRLIEEYGAKWIDDGEVISDRMLEKQATWLAFELPLKVDATLDDDDFRELE